MPVMPALHLGGKMMKSLGPAWDIHRETLSQEKKKSKFALCILKLFY
jgi:hypothetical protein